MIYTKRNAFTLVELIVVVTILAILATIGFVSYSSYLTGVRDTNRLAQLTSISDGLNLYSTRNDLPIPDDNVEVSVSGSLIAYQGTVGANTLETIDFTKGGKDPRDNEYFTYYLADNRKQFQLLGFLEEDVDNTAQIFLNTNAIDYSSRIPTVTGAKLGVLLDMNKNPIQNSGNNIDIGATTDIYTAYFKDKDQITGSAGELLTRISLERNIPKIDPALLAYYKLDSVSGNSIKDYSSHGNDASFGGNIEFNKEYGYAEDNTDPRSAYINSEVPMNFTTSDYTMLAMSYYDSTRPTGHFSIFSHFNPGSGELMLIGKGSSNFNYYSNGNSWINGGSSTEYVHDQWNHTAFTVERDGSTQMFVNGKSGSLVDIGNFPDVNILFGVMSYGSSTLYSVDKIDEIRLYDRKLSEQEIQTIYGKLEKKYKYDIK